MPHVNVHGYEVQRIDRRDFHTHRLVMGAHLKRNLESDEHVHHIDGNKLNNRIDNLMLITNSEHQKLHRLGSVRNPERQTAIYELSDAGVSQSEIARRLEINQSVVSRYLSRRVEA